MTDYEGDYIVPPSQSAPGEIVVYDWAKCRVLVDKQVIDGLIEMTCTRSADISSGSATLKVKDVDKTIYNQVQAGQEVEIYLSEQSPLLYANKVWGGYLESREFDVDRQFLLIIKAKEYSNNLILNMTKSSVDSGKNSFSGTEPGTAIKALMSNYQVDFTTDNVLTGTASTITADFLNMTLFDAIKKICDQFGYVFYVNLDKDLVVRQSFTVVATPVTDYLTYTDNLQSIKEEETKELLCNSVIVYGKTNSYVSNSGAPTTDASSIASYGTHDKRIIVSSLTTSADCTNFANAYIAQYKDPLKQYKTVSRLVAFSEPLEYIELTVAASGVSGQYQIREITHTFQKAQIKTEMTITNKISDLYISLGQLLGRVQAIEIKTFT
jgi:hypothetical protein